MNTPERDLKYWDTHKKIYFDELDTLDIEMRSIIMSKPTDSTTVRFNSKIDKMVEAHLKESNH
jgi:hypothetical protein